ncbi:MAG: DUF3179 domain-containing protein [Myxococcota bacterium]
MWWLFLATLTATSAVPETAPVEARSSIAVRYLQLLDGDRAVRTRALDAVTGRFAVDQVPMALEVVRFAQDPKVVDVLWAWIARGTHTPPGDGPAAWRWLWAQTYTPHPDYALFKATLYRNIDPKFERYFQTTPSPRIRLDEIRWGGVRQDGIPPLRDPKLETAPEATWLNARDVVFGTVVDGQARAFPKRILAWHELLTMTIGDTTIAGVYCTLCGSMIVYRTTVDGVTHDLGTSGFLYRSNKLMYDKATQSLWSTLGGFPVVGPLADQPIGLPMHSVVTTTWGAWRERHPDTLVLSIKTGHRRDYGEGVAYRDYFATDRLMFAVPNLDDRLSNKAPVLALRRGTDPVAISSRFLRKHPVHHEVVDGTSLVVLTDRSGAHRVYEAQGQTFVRTDRKRTATDRQGKTWTITEDGLVHGDLRLPRVPAHNAFWFGWRAAWPTTRLVQ